MFRLRHRLAFVASQMHELRSTGAQLVACDRHGAVSSSGAIHVIEVGIAGSEDMNGLRVYVNISPEERANDSGAFYSRRDNGPVYRWTLANRDWSATRVASSSFSNKDLSATSWKLIPTALRRSIVDHYQD